MPSDPETLGRYRLDRKLGAGGMAEVFLATQTGPQDTRCVVKRMLPGLSEDMAYVEMFLDEARVAARLAHPGIVQILDFGKEGDTYFIAMEYISGANLQLVLEALRSRSIPVPVPVAVKLVSLVAMALDHAHKATDDRGQPLKIIHRDVSPHNIMLSSKGEVKLIDFGIAKAADAFHKTEVGTLKGKFAYMAPEQLNHAAVDHRADLYSLGLVLYEMLAGIPAVTGTSHASVLANAHRRQYTPLDKLRPMTPEPIHAILDKALSLRPEDRYPTAAAMAQACEDFLNQSGQRVKAADLAALLMQASDMTPLESFAVQRTDVTRAERTGPQSVLHSEDQPTTLPAEATRPHLRRLDEDVPPTKLSSRPEVERPDLPTPIVSSAVPRRQEETIPTDPIRLAPDIQAVLRKTVEGTAPDLMMPTDPMQDAPDIAAALARPQRKSIPPRVGGAAAEQPTTPAGPALHDEAPKPRPDSTAVVMQRAFPKKPMWPRVLLVGVLLIIVGVEVVIVTDFAAPARAFIREHLGPQLEKAGLLHFFEEKK